MADNSFCHLGPTILVMFWLILSRTLAIPKTTVFCRVTFLCMFRELLLGKYILKESMALQWKCFLKEIYFSNMLGQMKQKYSYSIRKINVKKYSKKKMKKVLKKSALKYSNIFGDINWRSQDTFVLSKQVSIFRFYRNLFHEIPSANDRIMTWINLGKSWLNSRSIDCWLESTECVSGWPGFATFVQILFQES